MSVLSASYGRLARMRRSWYERHPQAQRSLNCPVISVGNLSVGGSGKTPIVATLARLLVARGQRPAILSRGYARRHTADGVVVVSNGEGVLAPVGHSGDEPQMLARWLTGVPVLVCPDRYLAGRFAERKFGCNVMLLDDGFQHLSLGREVDVLVMPASDLNDAVLPGGRLREPLDAASSADCILVPGTDDDVARVSATFDRMPVFRVSNQYERLRPADGAPEDAPLLDPADAPQLDPADAPQLDPADAPQLDRRGGSLDPPEKQLGPTGRRVVAVAGIARPARFFDALRAQGYDVVRELSFPDHRWYTTADFEQISAAVRASNADRVVTTEKDAVRLPQGTSWAVLPMTTVIDPADRFASWLEARL